MSNAREQAVERLAAILMRGLPGYEAAAHDPAFGVPDYNAVAATIMSDLGLVAVDPELVARVAAHPATVPEANPVTGAADGAPYHSADAPDCGIDGVCLRCQARLRIGDEALAQLGGGR